MVFWEMALGRNKGSRRRNVRITHPRNTNLRRNGKFRMDALESRFLLSADLLEPAAALAMSTIDTDPSLVLFADEGADSTAVLSNQGHVVDLAYNAANGEILVADTDSIDRIDPASGSRLGS